MKYANYTLACVQTLLVGNCHVDVHLADAQFDLRHTPVSPYTKQHDSYLKLLVRTHYFMDRVYRTNV